MLLDLEPGRSRFEGEAYSWLSSIVRREGEMIGKSGGGKSNRGSFAYG